MKKLKCCEINCNKDATLSITGEQKTDKYDEIHSCSEHLVELLYADEFNTVIFLK